MKHVWTQEAKCSDCKGTGIYKGIAEMGKLGVVCYTCKGTGKVMLKREWEDFEGKIELKNITKVTKVNPGICLSEKEAEGGMPYKDWFAGKPFPPKSELRKWYCPLWWYQHENYKQQPNWQECIVVGSFSSCAYFKDKDKCWERFDNERSKKWCRKHT